MRWAWFGGAAGARSKEAGSSFLGKMAAPLMLILILAVTIRAALYRSNLADLIAERVEVVSPLTAWKRGEKRRPRKTVPTAS